MVVSYQGIENRTQVLLTEPSLQLPLSVSRQEEDSLDSVRGDCNPASAWELHFHHLGSYQVASLPNKGNAETWREFIVG